VGLETVGQPVAAGTDDEKGGDRVTDKTSSPLSGCARWLLAAVGALAIAFAVWQFVSPPTAEKTTTERTPATTSAAAGPTTSTVAPGPISKQTTETSDNRPDALILAFAGVGLLLLVTAALPGQIKLGFGGATAEVAAKTTVAAVKADGGLEGLQRQLNSIDEEFDLRVRALERRAKSAAPKTSARTSKKSPAKKAAAKRRPRSAVPRKRT